MNNLKENKIAYLLPCSTISGGTAIVLHHLNRLKDLGYQNLEILVLDGDTRIDWFPNEIPIKKISKKDWAEKSRVYDILVATHWTTASIVNQSQAKRKIYFVQSDERRFVLCTSDLEKVEETYKLNMEYMTEAIWIQRWLLEEFGHSAFYVPNGLDPEIFHIAKPLIEKGTRKRILLEGPLSSHFKGMKDAYRAVKDLGCDIWLVSSSGILDTTWDIKEYFNGVPQAKMSSIYSSCDVFLKMSRVEGFFGPPMEAMACGCPVVVSRCTGYDEYITEEENALVVEMGDFEAASKAIKRILSDKTLAKKIIANGLETSKAWSWGKSIDYLLMVIEGDPPKEDFKEKRHERYDYVKEMRALRYQLEIVDYATQHYRSEVIRLSSSGLTEIRRISYKIIRKIIHHIKLIRKKYANNNNPRL